MMGKRAFDERFEYVIIKEKLKSSLILYYNYGPRERFYYSFNQFLIQRLLHWAYFVKEDSKEIFPKVIDLILNYNQENTAIIKSFVIDYIKNDEKKHSIFDIPFEISNFTTSVLNRYKYNSLFIDIRRIFIRESMRYLKMTTLSLI